MLLDVGLQQRRVDVKPTLYSLHVAVRKVGPRGRP